MRNGRAPGGDPFPFFNHGAGLYVGEGVNLSVENSIITANEATGFGGGLVSAGNLTLMHTTVQSNTAQYGGCLLYTSPSPRDGLLSRMPSSA